MPDIDWTFIGAKEGGRRTQAYLPCTVKIYTGSDVYDAKKYGSVVGKSGVTVATGFDIGQHNDWDLKALGLSKDLRAKLSPFLLLKKQDAIKKLEEKKGLKITDAEAHEIDVGKKAKVIKNLASNYDKAVATVGSKQFGQLPSEIQTAIASFAFQWGDNLQTPKEPAKSFWALVIAQDFEAAAQLLEKQKQYVKRRKDEAALLRKGLKAMPAASTAGGAAAVVP